MFDIYDLESLISMCLIIEGQEKIFQACIEKLRCPQMERNYIMTKMVLRSLIEVALVDAVDKVLFFPAKYKPESFTGVEI